MTISAERPLPLRFLRFLGPLVLTNVLNALSGTLNIIFLGQLLGAASMAAAVGFFPAFMFLIAFVIGLGTGASVLVGQAHGAREPDKVCEVAGAVLLGGVLLGVLVLGESFTTVHVYAFILALAGLVLATLPTRAKS